jgi:RNA polymerase sigma-70 factor (ECF subfamily)
MKTSVGVGPNSGVDPLSALLAGSSYGDEGAFADLYRETRRAVYTTAFRMLCSRGHAEEVTQEVYVQVWQQAARYDPSKGTVLGWMKMLAHRRAVDRVRSVNSANSRDRAAAQLAVTSGCGDDWDDVATRIDARQVHHALAQLTDLQREAVTLMYFDDRSMKQIASHLRLPLGTVKTRVRNGMISLRHTCGTSTRVARSAR